ncbi:uncharacterized protein MELLADRAFT_115371 [Melampsora larici-populina 98AG31]|uniref:RRM domain-containing protein n=1 Tax=Melampsora larici-populina (strain 98AG31 / pathotype 3-4-7) TaxID=747676 RepID=F4R9N2_MELLP|nr:uncharacterized protein MELLADRAFT_115371 [Melampsora larici-populina 98AG31]EGG11009.1 hypothetical protein MELLADRAFT_115371 [Melampsora larici-populina 98AG31]
MSQSSSSDQESDHQQSEIYNHHQKRPLDSDYQSSEESDSESESKSEKESKSEEEEEEIQVLSHKERRKRKKLCTKQALNPIPNPAPKATKGEYGIWVGNLLFTTTQSDLETFFSSCGRITRFNFPTKPHTPIKPNQRNPGYAYIDFESEEGMKKALQKTESLLGGRKLLIKRSNDYCGRPKKGIEHDGVKDGGIGWGEKGPVKGLDRMAKPAVACLFLGNLSFESTSESIMKHFKSNHQTSTSNQAQADDPAIRQIRLGTFEDSGKCKGFGFLDFRDTHSATQALMNKKNHRYLGRQIKVEYASEEAARRGGGSHASLNRNKSKSQSNHSNSNSNSKQTQRKEFKPRVDQSRIDQLKDVEKLEKIENMERIEKVEKIDPQQVQEVRTKKSFQGRLTPGAALANAQRAPTGIIRNPEKVGKKIVF